MLPERSSPRLTWTFVLPGEYALRSFAFGVRITPKSQVGRSILMARVVHFEVHAEDPQRAVRFYSGLFGWEFTKWEGPQDYWLIKTGPGGQAGINGGMVRRHGPGPSEGQAVFGYVCTLE